MRLRRVLLDWYQAHKRDLPWRRTVDPYAIWLSETMLQQTRVSTVVPYYERFLQLFPNVHALARAPEPQLLAAWAGLGYYYRARNLQKAAQQIARQGEFPQTREGIRALPGVGDYTSAAVASIAFGLPHAVVDGNVLRVLSRFHADPVDVTTAGGRKHFARIADELLDPTDPSAFNQSLMELGATICLPKNPRCLLCPARDFCKARAAGRVNEFPVKRAKQQSIDEERTLYWIEEADGILAWQRPPDSRLMPGFWELPEVSQLGELDCLQNLGSFRHGITFHRYRFQISSAQAPGELGVCCWIPINKLNEVPLSTVFRKALRTVRNPHSRGRVLQVD